MTSLTPPTGRRLTYKVSLLQREDWSVACSTDGLDKALVEARRALATGLYQRVKVVVELYRLDFKTRGSNRH